MATILAKREELWSDLELISLNTKSINYIAFGDFNVVLSPEEVSDANFGWNNEIKDFKSAINLCCLEDLRYVGELYTWTNRRYMEGQTLLKGSLIELLLINLGSIIFLSLMPIFKLQVYLITLLPLFTLETIVKEKVELLNSIIIGLNWTIMLIM